MSSIQKRLRASVSHGAHQGDSFERSVCGKQMIEAANRIGQYEQDFEAISNATADLMVEFGIFAPLDGPDTHKQIVEALNSLRETAHELFEENEE